MHTSRTQDVHKHSISKIAAIVYDNYCWVNKNLWITKLQRTVNYKAGWSAVSGQSLRNDKTKLILLHASTGIENCSIPCNANANKAYTYRNAVKTDCKNILNMLSTKATHLSTGLGHLNSCNENAVWVTMPVSIPTSSIRRKKF